jgi:Na+/phosphate symporter
MKRGKIKVSLAAACVVGISIINTIPIMAASDAATVTNKVNQGLIVIRGVLTGIIVVVGVIAALKVVISKLPSLDDPHVKNEMWRSVGAIGLAVAVGGALVWLIPWVYGLFQ